MENAHDTMLCEKIGYSMYQPSKAVLHRIMDLHLKKQSAFNILPLSVMFAIGYL